MSHKIFGNNLLTIRKSKVSLKLDKPPYTGICILELSMVLMYEFHYDYIKNKYDDKSKLLFTHTEDVYEDFSSNKEIFNFSNYLTKSKYCDDSNKLVIGKMKDETGGVAIK